MRLLAGALGGLLVALGPLLLAVLLLAGALRTDWLGWSRIAASAMRSSRWSAISTSR